MELLGIKAQDVMPVQQALYRINSSPFVLVIYQATWETDNPDLSYFFLLEFT